MPRSPMLNFSNPVTMYNLEEVAPVDFLRMVQSSCSSGRPMHPESLKAVVLKLTMVSRNMDIKQHDRDTAAGLATDLANAALKANSGNREYCMGLRDGIQSILNGTFRVAAS